MRVCWCSLRNLLPCVHLRERHLCRRFNLIYEVFYFNNDDSVDLRIDTLLQPLFYFVDHGTKYMGRLFICFFIIIISVVVYIFYSSIFVHLFHAVHAQHTYFTFIGHLIVSHWLLMNIMFNYFQCVRVNPGSSPNFGHSEPYDFDKQKRDFMKRHQASIDSNNNNNNKQREVTVLQLNNDDSNYVQWEQRNPLQSSSSMFKTTMYTQNICRKCIFPKPARAHHCSICARCILNQDHHCPWINNCVGHLNHRYFFQFCFFLTLGAFYAATLGFSEFQHYLFGRKVFSYLDLLFGQRLSDVDVSPDVSNPSLSYTFLFLFIVAITACVVLAGFTLWHCWLISRAETTIEFHGNSFERKRLATIHEKFINPYDLGFILNWKMFLGINHWYEMIYRNFLPSTHKPFCDGINWPIKVITRPLNDNKQLNLIHDV